MEVGLIYLPIALVVGGLMALVGRLPLIRSLLDGEIEIGIVGVLLTVAVGSLGHAVDFVIATAMTATLMRGMEADDHPSARAAYRRTCGRLGGLLRGLVRAIVIVGVLLVSVVGLLLRVLLSGIPLWAFSVIVTVVAALFVPYASIGLVLLYGDAVAERDGIEAAEQLEPAGGARAR